MSLARRSLLYLFLIEFLLLGISFNIFGPLIPVIAGHYSVNLITVGFNLSLHAVALLATSLAIGRINQRTGSRNIILAGMVLEVISFIGIYFSSHFFLFIIFYFLFGVGMASVIISVSSLTCDIIPAQKSRNLTILNIAISAGVFMGPLLVSGFLRTGTGWLYLFLIIGLLKIPILAVLYLISRTGVPVPAKRAVSVRGSMDIYKALFKNRFILTCIAIVFLHQGFFSSFMSWFTVYFQQYGVKVAQSSIYLSFFNIAIIAGLIVKTFLLKNIDEKKLMMAGYAMGFMSLIGFYFVDILTIKVALAVLFGLSVPGFFMLSLSLAVGHFKDNTGTVSSTIFSFGYLGMVFYQFFSGYISETYSPDLLFVVITVSSLVLVGLVTALNVGFRD